MLTFKRVSLRQLFSNSSRSHTHQLHTEINQTHRAEEFLKYYTKSALLPGSCSVDATLRFSQRSPSVHPDNWKHPFDSKLSLSSIGIGSYSTHVQHQDDIKLFNAIVDSVMLGVNVFDTCSQFRYSKGERVINAALNYLQGKGYSREEFLVCTKLGYLSDDMDLNTKGDQIVNELIKEKLMEQEDVVEGTHCVHPSYLEYMFERSRTGLGVEVVDVMYLNNFAECQMQQTGKQKWTDRLAKAFQFFEGKVQSKQLQYYGLASFSSFRVSGKPYSLQLQEVQKVAQKVAGKGHKFRFLEIPMNIVASESYGAPSQTWQADGKKEQTTVVAVANRLKINIVSCSPFMKGTLINVPVPGSAMKCNNNGAKHLQFIRSIPIPSLLTTLVGQNLNRHVKTNLQVLTVPRLTWEEWIDFVKPSIRKDVDSQ